MSLGPTCRAQNISMKIPIESRALGEDLLQALRWGKTHRASFTNGKQNKCRPTQNAS